MRNAWKSGTVAVAVALLLLGGAAAWAHEPSNLENRIHAALVDKLGEAAQPIQVAVAGDKAVLAGEVSVRPVQELCKEVALSVPGIERVDNDVKLSPRLPAAGKVKGEATDVKLEIAAKARLESQVGNEATRSLEVEAVDGWVSLRGTLQSSTHKDLAIRSIQNLEGVTKVVDLITVQP